MPHLAEQRSLSSESAVGKISDISITSLEIVTPGMVFGVILKAFGIILVSSGTMGRQVGSHMGPCWHQLAGWLAIGIPGGPPESGVRGKLGVSRGFGGPKQLTTDYRKQTSYQRSAEQLTEGRYPTSSAGCPWQAGAGGDY